MGARPSGFHFRVPRALGLRWRTHLRLEQLESRTLLSVFSPGQIQHAYAFDQVTFRDAQGNSIVGDGSGQTIAIIDAYDHPNIESDLQYFDSVFGLPDPVFTKATPQGTPAVNSGWALEIALDVEWAHAMAPGANILLVEARSASFGNLLSAVDYARNQAGVSVVSMSWGAGEFSSETLYDNHFTTPAGHGGVTFVAASGDSGTRFGPEWPSVSANVLAVGGTTLNVLDSSGTYGSEVGWSGSGGGYSSYVNEPDYQLTAQSSGVRTTPDVSYDANPGTGYYVYDTIGHAGWLVVGGTSAGAPQWGALVAVANQGRALAGQDSLDGPSQTLPAIYNLANTSQATYFHAIASDGYDLVTGLGTPVASQLIQGLASVSDPAPPAPAPVKAATATQQPSTVTVNPNVFPGWALIDSAQVGVPALLASYGGQPTSQLADGRLAAVVPPVPGQTLLASSTGRSYRFGGASAPEVRSLPEFAPGLIPDNASRREVDPYLIPDDQQPPYERPPEALVPESSGPDAAPPPVVPADLDTTGKSSASDWSQACDAYFAADEQGSAEAGTTVQPDFAPSGSVPVSVTAATGLAVLLGGYWGIPAADTDTRKRRTLSAWTAA